MSQVTIAKPELVFNSIQERTYVNTAVGPSRLSRYLTLVSKFGGETWPLLLLLATALGLRLFNLTRLSLWQDEAYHLYVAKNLKFLDTFSYNISYNTHPPFFYPVMYLWLKFAGTGDFAVRLFSVIAALVTLVLVYFMARRWLNQKLALTGLLLLTFSPLHLFWSQSIRSYSWFTLLVTISMFLAFLASEKPEQNWRWALYVVSGVILIYTHYYGFYAVASQGLFWLLVLYKNRVALLRAGISLGLVAASFIPWFPNFKEQTSRDITGYLAHNVEIGQVFKTFEGFSSWYSPDSFSVIVGAVFLPLYALGAVWLWRNKRNVGILLLSWSLTPVILAWLAAQFQPNFQANYFSFCLPAFLLVVGAGAWSLQSYSLALSQWLLILAVALNLASIFNYNTTYQNQDWRAMANYIAANHQEGDLILFANPFGYLTPPFDFYYDYALNNPGKLEQHSVPYDFSLYPKPQPQKPVGDMVKELFNAHKRVWVIWKHDENAVWMVDNVFNQVPANFQSTYKQDYPSTEQGTINFAIYVRNDSK